MLIPYCLLLVIWIASFILFVIAIKSDDCDSDVIRAVLAIGSAAIVVISLLGMILSAKTGKVYRSEYDKIIQNIDSDKTKVFKEDDEITDIYITVNGQEYHFDFKEKTTNE